VITQHAGSISGTVTESDGGRPVENLHVYAVDACLGDWLGGANTDANGDYTLYGIPAGLVVHVKTCAECSDHPYINQINDGGSGFIDCEQALGGVPVTAGQTTVDIDFSLETGVTISGRVTDTSGNPIPNLWLQAFDNVCGGNWLGGASTNDQGYYTTSGIPAGDVYIEACPECDNLNYVNAWWTGIGSPGSNDCSDAQNLILHAGVNITDIDFQLVPKSVVSGTVFDLDGITPFDQPVHINIYQGDPCGHHEHVAGNVLDPFTGMFSIHDVPPGQYYLRMNNSDTELTNAQERWWNSAGGDYDCDQAELITIIEGQDLTGLTLITETGATVSGTVYEVDGTTPIHGNWGVSAVRTSDGRWLEGASIQEDGTYQIGGLVPGEYYILAHPDTNHVQEYYDNVLESRQAAIFTITGKESITEINFALETGGTVSGTVYETDGTTPIPNLHLFAQSHACGGFHMGGTNTDADGNYVLGGLPAGTVHLYACSSCVDKPFVDGFYNGGTSTRDCSQAVDISVTAGQTTSGIDFALEPGVTVSGILYQDDGVTPFDQPVHINIYQGDPCGHHEHVEGTVVDPSTGMYAVHGVPPGQYYMVVNNSDTEPTDVVRRWWNSSGGSIDCAQAEQITLTEGQDLTDMQFQAAVGGIVSGIILDDQGQPVEGVKIEIWSDKCWENFLGQGYTNAAGNFRVENLPAQEVYVRTCADCDNRNYSDEWWDEAQGTTDCNQAAPVQVTAGMETADINFSLGAGNTRIYWSQVDVTQGKFGGGFDIFPGYEHLIESASLAGPNGFLYEFDMQNDLFSWLNECNYMVAWWHDVGDTFDYGQYTFTITFKDGYEESQSHELYEATVIPVDIASMSHTVNPNGSIDFSWTSPDLNQRYQVRIYQNGERIYRSSQVLDMDTIHVPADQLRCVILGGDAVWEVRSFENSPTENAIERSGFLPLNYDPAALDTRTTWFEAAKAQADPDYLALYFNVRPGSREQVTSALVTGPDGFTPYSFDLVNDWIDISTESRRLNGWYKTISTETEPVVDGEYTLTVSFNDGHEEIRDFILEADVLTPVDQSTMGYEILENGAMRFYWSLPEDVTGQNYRVKIRSTDSSREYASSYSVMDGTEVWLSKWDLRALPHTEKFSWLVRTQDEQWDTRVQSATQLFTYNPFDIPLMVKETVVLTAGSGETTISADSDVLVYGTSSSDRIILESGARAELINFPGDNEIGLESMSDLFTVSRSGTIVSFQGTDGTSLKIPATSADQTIQFSDRSLQLTIQNNRIFLGDQEVPLSSEPIEE